MAARGGMADLILATRRLSNAGTADLTTGWGETLFSDDHVQDALDRYRRDLNRVPLTPEPEHAGGRVVTLDYYAPAGNLEAPDGDSLVFAIEDTNGDVIDPADYTVDYARGHIRFSADREGQALYLWARTYDVKRAAADIWRQKAAYYAEQHDYTIDNHSMSRSQLIAHCLTMAEKLEREAGIRSVSFVRTDLR